MKSLQQMLREQKMEKFKSLNSTISDEKVLKFIHAIQHEKEILSLETPILEEEARCPMCSGSQGYVYTYGAQNSNQRFWFCGTSKCLDRVLAHRAQEGISPLEIPKRALEWKEFCDYYELGDRYYDIKFENIKQNKTRIEYLLKFCNTPKGVILMQGDTGSGKSYAALGTCELYTRNSRECQYFSNSSLMSEWLKSYQNGYLGDVKKKVIETPFLVVDDFGTNTPTPGFLDFFMEVMDKRLQWSNRGTIITTNLSDEDFSRFCGEALTDRIMTGLTMEFKGTTRREKQKL